MRVSIALTTCNGIKYLGEQLRSFLEQVRQPDELIICDDSSTDETSALIAAFALQAPFPVLFEVNDQRLGVLRNFNKALLRCTGDLIFLSDQDDVWYPNKIARMVALAENHPALACFMNDAIMVDRELRPNGRTKLEQIRLGGSPDSAFVMGCCVAIRRELLALLLPIPEEAQSHDSWIVQMADQLNQTYRLETPLQLYRRHGENVSNVIANRLDRPGRLVGAYENLLAVLRAFHSQENFESEHRFFRAAVQRLEECSERFASVVGEAQFRATLRQARRHHAILCARRRIRRLPRWERCGRIGALWRDGGYRESGRVRGAFKDLLIRK